jgi:hypothetical protein
MRAAKVVSYSYSSQSNQSHIVSNIYGFIVCMQDEGERERERDY